MDFEFKDGKAERKNVSRLYKKNKMPPITDIPNKMMMIRAKVRGTIFVSSW